MKKKDFENLEAEAVAGFETNEPVNAAEKADNEASGVYVYLGPTVKGIVTNGSIMRGTKNSVLEHIAQRAEAVGLKAKVPKIGRLLIRDKNVSYTKEQLKIGGNSISRAYEAVLAADKKGGK